MTDTVPAAEAHDDPSVELRPYSDVEFVFEPHGSTMPPLLDYFRQCWDRRHFVVAMAKADLRGPRSRTGLGELWAVMDPLFQAAIYWFLISTIRAGSGDGNERLTILVSGIFLWTLSMSAMGSGGRSIIKNKGLVLNTIFPRLLLPVTEVYKGLLDLGPALAVYAVIHFLLGNSFGPGLFLLPLLIFLQVLISTGVALVFATLTVFVSDMSNALDYILRVLFFTTPILYPVSKLPGSLDTILQVNPFFGLFASYQAIMLGGMPKPLHLAEAVAWAVITMVIGIRVFVSRERGFALRI